MSETMTKTLERATLEDLKKKSPTELLALAESLEVENASSLRTQELLFAILKEFAERDVE
ncbi:MAG: Rho termination factor N-terminal domain-containing protein, partial [Pseudomonadota bacterium]